MTVKLPIPVFAAEVKNLTAVGGAAPAGIVVGGGKLIEFVGFVHVPVAHTAERFRIFEASVDSVFGDAPPVENWVEVTVRFQPAPEPVASITEKGNA